MVLISVIQLECLLPSTVTVLTPFSQDITPEPPISQDADLGDPEVANAALKIQSGFRGHMAREEIKRKKVCHRPSKSHFQTFI